MPRPSPQTGWKWLIGAACALGVAALVGGALHYRDVVLPKSPPKPAPPPAPIAGPPPAQIYFADAEYTHLEAESRLLAAAATPEERTRAVVAELIAGPKAAEHSPTLPPDATLKSVFFRDRVAVLNFDERLRSKSFGSTGELFALNSLYRTVTANVADVDGVSILVDGRMYQTLAGDGGHIAAGYPIYGELGATVAPPPERPNR